MPRVGNRRKKRQTHVVQDEGETEKQQVPRCFVVKKGKVSSALKDLMQDFRKVMSPNCAVKLREKRNQKLRDYIGVANHFKVSHINTFTQTDTACYFKLGRLPQGPTLTFKLVDFSLVRDVKMHQKKPRNSSIDNLVAPVLVLNGFGNNASSSLKLTATVLRGMFPPVDVNTFSVRQCRRVVMFNVEKEQNEDEDGKKESGSTTIVFRHYAVAESEAGLSRGVKKILNASRTSAATNKVVKTKQGIADLVLTGGGADSDSECEDNNVVPVAKTKKERAQKTSTSGPQQRSIRLVEIGPRMKLQLVKGEEGLYEGAILFHRFIEKSAQEQEFLARQALEKQLKTDRKNEAEQDEEDKKNSLRERTEANKERKINRQLQEKGLLGQDEEGDFGAKKKLEEKEDDDAVDMSDDDVNDDDSMGEGDDDDLIGDSDVDMEEAAEDEEEDEDMKPLAPSERTSFNTSIETSSSTSIAVSEEKLTGVLGASVSRTGTVEFVDTNTQKKKAKEQKEKELKKARKQGGKGGKGGKGSGKGGKGGGKGKVMDKFKKFVRK